jgi:hypothetical protein
MMHLNAIARLRQRVGASWRTEVGTLMVGGRDMGYVSELEGKPVDST